MSTPITTNQLMNFLTKIGGFISFSSFFLTWFSCKTTSNSLTLNYIDVLKSLSPIFDFYGLFFVITICFLKKANIRELFALFLLLFFLLFLFLGQIFLYMTQVGIHMTVDFPCDAEFGFWCHSFGLVLMLFGGLLHGKKNRSSVSRTNL